MSEVKWIKICTDIFDNRKIKQLESLPQGDSIVVIWFKLLCLAGITNNSGFIYLTPDVPYTDNMLATEFGRPLSTIQLAFDAFQQFGMIEITDDIIHVSNWEKYQNVDGMERIKEQNRIRQKNWYERQKQLPNVIPNVSITQPNATDIDKEKEIETDKENKIYSSVIEYLNQKAGTSYRASTPKTKTLIHARTEEGFTEQDFKKVIDKKCSEWMGTDMEKYLRPETLFGTKFEGYLNAKEKGNDSRSNISSGKQSKASISIVYDN